MAVADVFADEELFDAAVRRAGGDRTFDAIGRPAQGQTADWVFADHRVIIEHKHIEREYADTSKFQTGLAALQAKFDTHPRQSDGQANFGAGVLRLFEPPLAALAKEANRQIKSTAELAGWSTFSGILVVANRELRALPSKPIMFVLQALLGRGHYRGIDAIIYQTDHFVSAPRDARDQLVWASALRPGSPSALGEFIDELGRTYWTILKERVGPFDAHVETQDKTALNGLSAGG